MKYYHNNRCRKSREGLAFLNEKDIYPEVINYMTDKINKAEDLFLNEMAHAGWDLFLINNEPMHEYPKVKVKLYFRKEVI